MRIGLLTAELSRAHGWATYSLNLVKALRMRGLDIRVACARNSPPPTIPALSLLPTVAPPDRYSLARSLRIYPRMRAFLNDCDIIHAAAEPYAILAAALAGARPLFITAHGSYVNLPRMRLFPVGALYRRAMQRAQLICVSHHTAKVARDVIPGARAQVINNGVDAARFLQPSSRPVDKRGPTVLAVGGVKPRKGALQLIEAMALVRQKLPEAQCVILGSKGAYAERVMRRAQVLGLGDSVRMPGFVEDGLMRAWMSAADVVTLPAMNDGMIFEGFGLTLLEASASGTAVVGTDNCGVADAIVHGETGLVVSQANVTEELPRALLDLLLDPARASRMGANGRDYAKTQSWDSVAERVIGLYQAALG